MSELASQKALSWWCYFGEPSGTRTRDPVIKSVYPSAHLNYHHMGSSWAPSNPLLGRDLQRPLLRFTPGVPTENPTILR